MTTPHDLEDAVRDRFERAMSDTTAPVDTLRNGAMTRGRRLRRRRQSLVAVGAVAAIAVTGFGVQYAAGGTQAEEANDYTQSSTPSTPSTPTDNTPSPSGGVPSLGPDEIPSANPDPGPKGWWSMPASTMVDELRKLLPEGMRLTDPIIKNEDRAPSEPLREMEGYLIATLRPETGGPGKANLMLYRPDPARGRLSCSVESVNDPGDCRLLKSPGGTVVGRVLDSTAGQVRALTIDLSTADGGVVMVSVANSLDEKWPEGASASADKVPLSLAQLRRIAESPVWTSYRP